MTTIRHWLAGTTAWTRPGQTSITPGGTVSALYPGATAFNTAIVASPVLDSNSATWTSTWTSATASHQAILDIYEFGCPIYEIQVGQTTGFATYNFTATYAGNHAVSVRIPDAAAPATGSDHAMVVLDWDAGLVYEFWNITKSGANWVNGAGGGSVGIFSISGDGITSTDGWKGVVGAGFSRALGLLTKADFVAGWPNGDAGHALVCPTPFSQATTFRYPAQKTDGSNTGGYANPIPEGARFQFDPTFNVATSGYTTLQKFIVRTLQKYGGYVMDNGGNAPPFICQGNEPAHATPPTDPGDPTSAGGWLNAYGVTFDYFGLGSIDWSKLRWLAHYDGS